MRWGASSTTVAMAWLSTTAAFAEAPRLSLPVDCEPGKTCFIQSHVDIDPGPGVLDHRCGSATYDGHSGVDFRLLSAAVAARGIAVRAAAPGVVKGFRDGMPDIFSRGTSADVKARECGNGVVIDHGGGWETQYCHLRRGSVAVKTGDSVVRGAKLGDVGYSGAAEFAHLHLSVRHQGQVIEPFSGRRLAAACDRDGTAASPGLWEGDVAQAFGYRTAEILGAGFAGGPVDHAGQEVDHSAVPPASRTSAALVLYVRAMNLRAGDRIRVSADGPAAFRIDETLPPVDRAKATFTQYAGSRRHAGNWPVGTYTGRVSVLRDGRVVSTREATLTLN